MTTFFGVRRIAGVVGILCGFCAHAAQVTEGFGDYAPPPRYDDFVTSSFYLELRDGVKVAVRVDRPAVDGEAATGRFPIIWQHALSITVDRGAAGGGAAGGGAPGFRDLWTLTRHGYVVVQVARRGSGQSFGTMRGYHDRNEAEDAWEITRWLARQSWSDGNVGIYGCSNTGDAAMHAATVRPPALKAVFAGCFSWHKYDPFRRGGIYAQWGTGPMRTIEQDLQQEPVDSDEEKRMLRQAAEEHQRAPSLLELWQSMPYRDSWSPLVASPFWQEGSSANYREQIRDSGVAVYVVGGWFDELRDQGFIAFGNLPGARIIVGPWKHCMNDDFSLLNEAHRFFDTHLKGLEDGAAGRPRVHYFRMNGTADGTWRAADEWPLTGTRSETLYLAAGRALAATAARADTAPQDFRVRYDVECPPPGRGPAASGPFTQPCFVPGAGLSFSQPALVEDTEVTGHPVANLWVSADAADAHVFAYLEDVAPDGTITPVTEGRLKASLRATHEAPWAMPGNIPWHRAFAEDAAPLLPGEPVLLSFDLLPTSWVFRRGHRVQVTITGADPRERLRDESGLATRISVYADGEHPSSITLPVIPE
ncbi:MAG TPA: CocE/NonD family hydrolase [Woeseiaceae bacterium]|nr:CocE/NonD family hydrolase [Woeseiaceae bacterium]